MSKDQKESGGQVFPVVEPVHGSRVIIGISLRDYFAGRVIQGAMENRSLPCNCTEAGIVATHTYMLADAMLKARQQ